MVFCGATVPFFRNSRRRRGSVSPAVAIVDDIPRAFDAITPSVMAGIDAFSGNFAGAKVQLKPGTPLMVLPHGHRIHLEEL